MSKSEKVIVTQRGRSFNSHTCTLVSDGKDGGRIVIEFDNVRRMRNAMAQIAKGGAKGIDLDTLEAYFVREYGGGYTRADVGDPCNRLVKLGFVTRIGKRKNPTFRCTKAGYERFKSTKKVSV
jgi:hypothetical protein